MKTINRFLPEKPLIENDDFVIYGNDDLEGAKDELLNVLSAAKKELLSFFGLESFEKIPINLYNDHDAYIEFTKQFYEPAPYSRGNFIDGMISQCYDANRLGRLKRNLVHELVHILYESIWKTRYDRVVWLDEGLAQNLSKEMSLFEHDKEKFKEWYLDKVVRRDKEIPRIEYLREHGTTYGKFVDKESGKYDGYALSYLMVRYLIESGADILSLLYDIDKIRELEGHILEDAIDHFNRLFKVDEIKESFYDVETPQELMDYMNKNVIYGWIDNSGNSHIENLKNFRENYRTGSLEEVIETGLGTCIEQAFLIKAFFDRKGIENKLFCHRRYETEKNLDKDLKMHCFVVYHQGDKWYHFEHSDSSYRGFHMYDSLEAALEEATYRPNKEDIRELAEIPEVPAGLSFQQFNEYVNGFSTIEPVKYKKSL